MAPERRRRRLPRRWNRGHNGGRVDRCEDTIAGEPVRRVVDTYCPYCATDIRAVGPRRFVRCPNISLCGKILPIDDSTCPSCTHYTRPTDNFCRVCRANLRGVVRGRGGLYQHLRRAPSPINNASPPREEEQPEEERHEESDFQEEEDDIPSSGEEDDDEMDGQEDQEHQGENAPEEIEEPINLAVGEAADALAALQDNPMPQRRLFPQERRHYGLRRGRE